MDFQCYEREAREAYAALAETIATILTAAIGAERGYRLQQVTERAKQPASLLKKLEQRGIATTTALENDIKDLAGCRIIFYTNGDVTRFINSGIIDQNFEVLEAKIHHPGHVVEDAAELYISNHYLVRLRPERIALPEYAHFSGMRCEIQIQTILNHAWAEMAHDTIYKAPTLVDFGGKEFDGIKSRLQKVARKYLLPAGYEFQKIASDFQRLIEGKALFDGDALEAIVDAADNNVRVAALETFAENVLPLYDDLQTVYPEIFARLVEAADRARVTPPVVIETPYGTLPAKTYSDVVKAIADIFARYRYLNIAATFDALCRLYGWAAGGEDEQKPLIELGMALAKHQLHVWQQHGPAAQVILVERIEMLGDDERRVLSPLLSAMLGEMLGTEISGTTNSSIAVTFHRGAVVASDALRDVRTKAIALLKRQFALAVSDEERRAILLALQAATRLPFSAGYSNALARLVMDDTRTIMEFQTEIVSTLGLDLRQTTEDWIHRGYWRYAELPQSMREDPELVAACPRVLAAALAFRDVVNADPDFEIYKILVGFNSVYPPAWEDEDFSYEQTQSYRTERVDALLASVNETNADVWFDRISRYARTESNDAATFPVFGNFLDQLAEAQPAIVFSYIDRLEGPLENFLPPMLAGLMRSTEHAQALARVDAWLGAGKHIGKIAWYLRFADPFDEALLRRALASALQHSDRLATRNVLIAAVNQFATHPGTLIEAVFLPALRYLAKAGDFSWVRMPWFSWLNNPIIQGLDEEQASIVLNALVSYPELEYDAEHITAAIAKRWPASVVTFIGKRLAFARTDAVPPHYDAVPFAVHELQAPLAVVPDLMLVGARTWFDASPQHFTYDGGRLLASVFPDLSNGLETRLAALIAGGNEQDLAFALGVLSAFEGKPCIYGLVRATVVALGPESRLLCEARSVLQATGVVSGEFGFAELHAERKALLEPWLTDPHENVRIFATKQIHELDRQIASETRSAEASIAMRKLNYDEELDGGKSGVK
ncbi:GTP pyrophosphokinase [Polaromonas sp. AET17H-212]|uniref:GTP pyrophosphokinase n=1 Tax=Polaromonas sp. AET17H-212 TaxID=1977061 RepID=UPI000BBBCB69|nr:RelA/SpoT domain-containing protein [Polaromonas sp. AET17H-212]